MSVMDLFDHYTEDDERRKMTPSQRFAQTAARTFLSDVETTTTTTKQKNWLPIRKLANHMQHVILKNVDVDLYRCLTKRKIDPSLYALRWMRCLFSNVLSTGEEEEVVEVEVEKEKSSGGGSSGNSGNSGSSGSSSTDSTVGAAASTSRSPLRYVLIVWDAMLGCRERVFDFIEAMCVSMLLSMRTALLNSDENEMLMLLMRYTMAESVTEMAASKGNNQQVVQGLVSMALEIMESTTWPKSNYSRVEKLIENVWRGGVPIDLQESSATLRKKQEEEKSEDERQSKGVNMLRQELLEMMDVDVHADSGSGSGREFNSFDTFEDNRDDDMELMDFRAAPGTPSTCIRDDEELPRKKTISNVELQYIDPESVGSEELAASQMPSI